MDERFIIRAAEPRDDVAIGELLVRAFVETYARKMPEVVVTERRMAELRAVASKRAVAHVWVAEQAGRVVGTVALWPPGVEGNESWLPKAAGLRHLAVDSSVRGQGVSDALVDRAELAARALGASSVCLHVRRGATGVRAFYVKRAYLRREEGDHDMLPEVFLEAFEKCL